VIGLINKRSAIDDFTRRLLSSEVGEAVAKIVLFGSVLRGSAGKDSDIDLMVIASSKLEQVTEACSDAAFETLLKQKEGVETIVHCLDEWRFPTSYLVWQVKKEGKEIYTMEEKEIRRAEAQGYLEIAGHYLDAAKRNMEAEDYRVAADLAYNAAELSAKGLLILKLEELPCSHRGVVNRFSELYIQDGSLPKELGRRLNRGLSVRNQARYEPHIRLGKKEADEMVDLAEDLTRALEERLTGE